MKRQSKTFRVKLLPERSQVVKTASGQAGIVNLSLDRMFAKYVGQELRKNDSNRG